MIDWSIATRIARNIAGDDGAGLPAGDLIALCEDGRARVVAYTGLEPAAPLPPPEAVGRHAWLEANLASMRTTLAPATDGLLASAGPLRGPAGMAIGAEVGALTGYLGRRVLGQYDLAILDPSVTPRLLFVVPNLAEAAAKLDAEPETLLAWVAFHEVTHAVQFGAVPWLREHLAGLLRELLAGMEIRVDAQSLLRIPSLDDLRGVGEAIRGGSLMRLMAGRERAELLDRMQAVMALIEGHAEHVMDAVGVEALPDVAKLRTALDRRRAERGGLVQMLERLLGLDMKMRQYQQGKRFCDIVVANSDVATLHLAFSSPELLPTPAELEAPASWLTRVRA